MKRTLLALAAAALITTGFAAAQQPYSGTPAGRMDGYRAVPHNRINARRAEQQNRIAQGVRSGQLTPRETTRLERRETRINREIRHDRVEHGGTLTPRERHQISRQQNRVSRTIYRDKHNGARQF